MQPNLLEINKLVTRRRTEIYRSLTNTRGYFDVIGLNQEERLKNSKTDYSHYKDRTKHP